VSTTSSAAPNAAVLQALQDALAAEHAAVYGYGVVGGRLSGAAQTQARAALDAHRARRDALVRSIADLGGVAEPAAPAYTLPFPVETPADATRLAVYLEDGVAMHMGALVAASTATVRANAASWLRECAVWGVRWRGGSITFPGLPTPVPGTPTAGGGT